MPRKDLKTGKFIISAGEVGSYTICPESWRLQYVERIKSNTGEHTIAGEKLHGEWAERYERAQSLAWQAKLTILLIMITILVVVLLLLR